MRNECTAEYICQGIQTIHKTAEAVAFLLDEDGMELVGRLKETAEAIQKQFKIEMEPLAWLPSETAAEEIETAEKAKELNMSVELPSYGEAENVRDTIYAMCDTLDNPKEIMRHVRTACEMLDVWYPERISA